MAESNKVKWTAVPDGALVWDGTYYLVRQDGGGWHVFTPGLSDKWVAFGEHGLKHRGKLVTLTSTIAPCGPRVFGAELEVIDRKGACDERIIVRDVVASSIADDLGLRNGDVLRSVNGHVIEYDPDPQTVTDQVLQALRDHDDRRFTVEVGRGGSPRPGPWRWGDVGKDVEVVALDVDWDASGAELESLAAGHGGAR